MILQEEKLLRVLEDLGISIYSSSGNNITAFCPFHDNRNSPAFSISKVEDNHVFLCFNPTCGEKGTLVYLVKTLQDLSDSSALNYLKGFNPSNVETNYTKKKKERNYKILTSSLNDLSYNVNHLYYMFNRGFTWETLKFFGVGYKDREIYIPCFDEKNQLVGFARRRTYLTKRKYFDKGLPKSQILFNLNNGRNYDELIIVEGPMDAMMIHQAGFPNVAAILSGNLSDIQADLLRRFSRRVIIFFDNDEAGRNLMKQLEVKCKDLMLYYVEYPEGFKDPCDLGENRIREVLDNKKSLYSKVMEEK